MLKILAVIAYYCEYHPKLKDSDVNINYWKTIHKVAYYVSLKCLHMVWFSDSEGQKHNLALSIIHLFYEIGNIFKILVYFDFPGNCKNG